MYLVKVKHHIKKDFIMKKMRIASVLFAMFLGTVIIRAENDTVFLVNTGTSNTTNYILGSNGVNNALIVTNGAKLVNAGYGIIGSYANANLNRAYITGNGSYWSNESYLAVGNYGKSNILTISQTGYVADANGIIGYYASADFNTVIVDNGTLSNSVLITIGDFGDHNRLIITNRGLVVGGADPRIGWGLPSASDNELWVVGTGSIFKATSALKLGGASPNNIVTISNGGAILLGLDSAGGNTYIGIETNVAGDNRILVTGSGSVYSNNNSFIIGELSSNNSVTVNAGGRLLTKSACVGYSGDWNSITVSGAGSALTGVNEIVVGSNSMGNRLTVSDGGYALFTTGYVGYGSAATNNVIVVSGPGSILSNAGGSAFCFLGYNGGSNTLIISDGGKLGVDMGIYVGYNIYSSNNLVNVTGTNSLIQTYQGYFGESSPGNRMVVSNGATVNSSYLYLGGTVGADHNSFVATDIGSVITGGYFFAGYGGDNNRFYATNGAVIYSDTLATISYTAGSDGNSVRLDGNNTRWISPNMLIGPRGASNSFSLLNGAALLTRNARIGQNPTASNNWTLISGAGSSWTNHGDLHIGSTGVANYLVISNGGTVFTTNSYIGYTNSAVDNWVLVSGNNSLLTNTSSLNVGEYGSSNTLTVSDHGTVYALDTRLGQFANSERNRLLINSSGTLAGIILVIGNYGKFNELAINSGGTVSLISELDIGYQTTSSNNTIVVEGPNSRLSTILELNVGLRGNDHSLTVSNNGYGSASVTHIGKNSFCKRSWARITGDGSILTNGNLMIVGDAGQYCNLFVENSGKVISQNGAVGNADSATNNEALITGRGSWSNLNTMSVGLTGAVNRLTLTNQGTFYSGNLNVGQESASTNNMVSIYNGSLTVTGLYNIIRGTNLFNAGLMRVGTLRMTNANGKMDFQGGILQVENSLIANGSTLAIGNGTDPATNMLVNNGVHVLVPLMLVGTNATLAGNGTVIGTVLLANAGRLSPGESCGTLVISNLTIGGGTSSTYAFEKSTSTSDWISIIGTLTFNAGAQLNVFLKDLGGANFVGTNVLMTYAELSGTPLFNIDYGETGLSGFRITNNVADKRIELISPAVPAAPAALAASFITTNAFTANWSAPVNATNYLLDVALDSSFNNFVPGYNNYSAGNVTNAPVGGLSPNSTYYYRVRAQGFSGASSNSATITVSTYPLPPASAPTGVNATKGAFTDRVRITWNSATNATSYEVWRNTAHDTVSAVCLQPSAANLSYDDTNVTVGTTYYYWLKAKNASGTSGFSSSDSGFASATVSAPAAPTGVTASKGTYGNKVVVTWNTVTNAASYEVWRNTVNDASSAAKFETEPVLTTYEDTGVTARAIYYYWLKAKNGVGTSAFSAFDIGFASSSGDIRWLPASADLDGDAKADPTVYQPSSGTWKTKLSSANYLTVATPAGFLGSTNYSGLAADFDGDAKADPTVYNDIHALWITRLSSADYAVAAVLPFGASNWTTVAADFDGDQLADPAIYSSSRCCFLRLQGGKNKLGSG
jgi:T5SS/PEP-CTERM-associated repeat protein